MEQAQAAAAIIDKEPSPMPSAPRSVYGRGNQVSVRRIMPDLTSTDMDAMKDFYTRVLGLRIVMDLGWIVTLSDPASPERQISLLTHDARAPVVPSVSIEVDDVSHRYRRAQETAADIVYPLTDEPWGVRRFFVRDPSGHVINILSHTDADEFATGERADRVPTSGSLAE
jgi:catechol 2,3-dioxygenase-like lactoylglutathione lyase family enzyme